ncbi:MAG: YbaB/EbfC family nucleoid-associated protein [Candidatus Dasytiphilus stammeri]
MFKTTEFEKLIKEAQKMQNKMQEIQKEISDLRFTGESGAGMVTITLDGQYNCHCITVDPTLINHDNIKILEELIAAAFNNAICRINEVYKEKMSNFSNLTVPYNFTF